jgi:hypothetical protein
MEMERGAQWARDVGIFAGKACPWPFFLDANVGGILLFINVLFSL